MIHIEVANRQSRLEVDISRLTHACEQILSATAHTTAQISLAVVDDDLMRQLNRDHLDHDYTTDVLSFPLDDFPAGLVGEIVVCAGVAEREARRLGVDPQEELLLYVIHGTLHLAGYRDKDPEDAAAMRKAEQYWLAALGIPPDHLARLSVVTDDNMTIGESLR